MLVRRVDRRTSRARSSSTEDAAVLRIAGAGSTAIQRAHAGRGGPAARGELVPRRSTTTTGSARSSKASGGFVYAGWCGSRRARSRSRRRRRRRSACCPSRSSGRPRRRRRCIVCGGEAQRRRVGTGVLSGGATSFSYRGGELYCEEVPVEKLVARVRHAALRLQPPRDRASGSASSTGRSRGVDRLIAYSVKANGNLVILRSLAERGRRRGHRERRRAAPRAPRPAYPADRIVFSGVGQDGRARWRRRWKPGIYGFNVESEGELRALSESGLGTGPRGADRASRSTRTSRRPTPHDYTRTGHRATKFGIPSEDARWSLPAGGRPAGNRGAWDRRAHRQPDHGGRAVPSGAAPRAGAGGGARGRRDRARVPRLGGGFGVSYDAASAGTKARDFAAVIVPLVAASGLRLVLEPGRFIVGPAGVLLTRVLYIKEMGGKTFVITDAGMNDLLRPSHYAGYHHVEPAERHRDARSDPRGRRRPDLRDRRLPGAGPRHGAARRQGESWPSRPWARTASPWRRSTTRGRGRRRSWWTATRPPDPPPRDDTTTCSGRDRTPGA